MRAIGSLARVEKREHAIDDIVQIQIPEEMTRPIDFLENHVVLFHLHHVLGETRNDDVLATSENQHGNFDTFQQCGRP